MSESLAASYDELPYEGYAFHETHPDHLAALAILHGLEPPEIASARVLELGCAGGANLVPMGLAWPGARFVGVDLSARQVDQARQLAGRLGLPNVEFETRDLGEGVEDLGEFDYVICHGVFSWVPEPVRRRILATCSGHLARNGVAYVSYNTFPGWAAQGMLRAMLIYHIGPPLPDGQAGRVRRARELLEGLVAGSEGDESPHAQFLRHEATRLQAKSDSYLLHEYLDAENYAPSLREFVEQAAEHGLRYLTDARPRSQAANQPGPVRAVIERLGGGPLQREQYADFLRNRTFRRSLLVHEEARPREPEAGALERLRALAAAGPLSAQPDVFSAATEEFAGDDPRLRLTTNDPLVKAALVVLAEAWPRSLAVPEWRARTHALLGRAPGCEEVGSDAGPEALNAAALVVFQKGLLELRTVEPPLASEIGGRPLASALARLQAETGRLVTNLQHRVVELSPFDRLVLRQLDGTREPGEVLDELVAASLSGVFPLTRDGEMLKDVIEVRQILGNSLGPSLRRLCGSALLTG